MSQASQKFPLGSIPTVFCESHEHELYRAGLGQENLNAARLPVSYEQQCGEDVLPC